MLVCTFHHKLVHEYGWHVELDSRDVVTWRRPDGSPFEPNSFEARKLAESAPAWPAFEQVLAPAAI